MALVGRMIVGGHLLPVIRLHLGKPGVAVDIRKYLGQLQPIRERQGLSIQIRAADDDQLPPLRRVQGLIE